VGPLAGFRGFGKGLMVEEKNGSRGTRADQGVRPTKIGRMKIAPRDAPFAKTPGVLAPNRTFPERPGKAQATATGFAIRFMPC
jgi:hypothetical protein